MLGMYGRQILRAGDQASRPGVALIVVVAPDSCGETADGVAGPRELSRVEASVRGV
jgi:hypothetical protein